MRQALPPYSSRLLFLGSCTLVVSIPLVLLALRLPSTSTFLQRTVDRVSGRIKEKKQRPRALPPASLHVHVALKGVTVRESDIGLLRSLLHPSITLTHGDEVDPLTQVLVANFPSKELLARLAPTLRALIFPFAGVPLPFLAHCASVHPHLSVHNLHHNAPPTAEMGLTLLLAAAKCLLPADAQLRRGDWRAGGGPSLNVTMREEAAGVCIPGSARRGA
ncbi:NAD(P)-binding domain protein [Nannochloropsis gaditana]|uniref:NAD(P)-binding domain protein n=1 Tax=Nannochloropsis gaditana TaxID=72520 RepID=W7TR15_9STRA|nr:NAD(P)-binding domain protein [Nannochloropsis gaditana]